MPISGLDSGGPEPLLAARGIVAGYGKLSVLEGVDLEVRAGEAVALLGPNGAGKSTLLAALSGLIAKSAGTVHFAGADITRATPQQAVRAGLVHVLEGHHVFGPLSVHDNLLLAGFNAPPGERAARIEEAYEAFPEMAERRQLRASALSGGQQQMLVVAQGIVRRPRLLMLDEPSAGLSPVLVDRVLAVAAAMRARRLHPARRAADREGARPGRSRLCACARPYRAGERERRRARARRDRAGLSRRRRA